MRRQRPRLRPHRATPAPQPRLFDDPEYIAFKIERRRLGLVTEKTPTAQEGDEHMKGFDDWLTREPEDTADFNEVEIPGPPDPCPRCDWVGCHEAECQEAIIVLTHGIIGTNITVIEAWEPVWSGGGHSTVRFEDGQQLGTVMSRGLPSSISRLAGGSPERVAAIVERQAALVQLAYDAIERRFPGVTSAADARCHAGRVEVTGHVADLLMGHWPTRD